MEFGFKVVIKVGEAEVYELRSLRSFKVRRRDFFVKSFKNRVIAYSHAYSHLPAQTHIQK